MEGVSSVSADAFTRGGWPETKAREKRWPQSDRHSGPVDSHEQKLHEKNMKRKVNKKIVNQTYGS